MIKVTNILVLVILMMSFTAKAQTTDIELGKINKIGYTKYIVGGKGYLEKGLRKLIIEKKKDDPLYKDIISYEKAFVPLAVGVAAGSTILFVFGTFVDKKSYLGIFKEVALVGGTIGLFFSMLDLKKTKWVIKDLPKAISLWNGSIEQDHSFVPYTSIGVTSHGVGLIHTF